MEDEYDQLNKGRKPRQVPLRTFLNKNAFRAGVAVSAVSAAISGCSSGPPPGPTNVVTADCNSLNADLSQALLDLSQTVGGKITIGTAGSVPALEQAAQGAAQNEFNARRVLGGEEIIVDQSYGPQYEAAASFDGFDGMVDCDELEQALDGNTQGSEMANAAGTEAIETTLAAAFVAEGLTKDPNKFTNLSSLDKTVIAKANAPLRAAVSTAFKLQGDAAAAGIQIPKNLQARV
jgi:hypothetical protein